MTLWSPPPRSVQKLLFASSPVHSPLVFRCLALCTLQNIRGSLKRSIWQEPGSLHSKQERLFSCIFPRSSWLLSDASVFQLVETAEGEPHGEMNTTHPPPFLLLSTNILDSGRSVNRLIRIRITSHTAELRNLSDEVLVLVESPRWQWQKYVSCSQPVSRLNQLTNRPFRDWVCLNTLWLLNIHPPEHQWGPALILAIRSISELAFQLIPQVLDGAEIRVLWRPVQFFHTTLGKPFLYGPEEHYSLYQRHSTRGQDPHKELQDESKGSWNYYLCRKR